MRKSTILGMAILLWATGMAFGQASLPAFYSGPWKVGPLPTGWTALGLRSPDYSENYDGVDGNAAGLDSSSDYIQINFNSSPGTVSYYTKINGSFGTSVFKVLESVDGSVWTDVETYDSGNPVPTTATQYEHSLLASSRYVKFLYVTKVSGNVGLDGILIEGPGVPTVTFNPNGSTNAPASNVFTMAVSILPSGAGMQSWNMLPAYTGPASLTNGNFTFTPASGDNGKTFTLSVIATNSVGTTTGTASIVVTAYVPPVPVITFSPAAPYSIMATETQRLGIGVAPAGSGIQSWGLLPTYSGAASLVGTNFSFITAQADGPSNYTLSVIATNVYGATTGTASIAVTAYVPPPPPGSVVVDFEDGPSKTQYNTTTNTMSGRSWLLSGVIGTLDNDKKFDLKALRIRCNSGDNEIKLGSLTPFTNGIDSITLWFASYGTDGTNNMPQVSIEISTNLDTGWITLDTFDTGSATSLVFRATEVKVREPVYFRLRAPQAGTDKRANIDNITISPYVAATGYNAFLLQYNVTPGDSGTAEGEDWDGDGWTNLQEFNAFPQTNPYDAASHPSP